MSLVLIQTSLFNEISAIEQQLLYSIKQSVGTMKAKKKSSGGVKKSMKKSLTTKPLMVIDKTVITTKERTHNTIEDTTIQFKEYKSPPRSTRNHLAPSSLHLKLEECSLSPFSSPEKSSVSPRLRKALSPSFKQKKQKKKGKGKNILPHQKCQQRKKSLDKKDRKAKPKTPKHQYNQAYQNTLLKRLQEKKIRKQSQEFEYSSSKFKKTNLNIQIPKQDKLLQQNKINDLRIKELRKKIYNKYQKELPSFKEEELKFYCSIVLIQRLFRQRRIKKIISNFISPRSNNICNLTGQLEREGPIICRLDLTATTEEQTCELIKKYHQVNCDKNKESQEEKIPSTEINSADKKVNLKQLELSEELSPQNETKMINLVEFFRDITFLKGFKNKGKMKQRMNVFNLRESLSEKCLMQSFYQKVFKSSPLKKNNFDLFKSKQEEKHLERSIELINSLSPQKKEVNNEKYEDNERYETELKPTNHISLKSTVDISVQTDQIDLKSQIKEIISIKQLNQVSQEVISILLNQFSQEFHSFTNRSILKKKKRSSLPGLKITETTIKEYLSGLSEYMMKNYDVQVIRRFGLINPMSFLKIHHQYDQDEEYYQEQEDEMNLPIVPNTLFYEYQQIYQAEKFIVAESQLKFANFLQGLIKINNLLLANCMSELLEKARIDRIILPWDYKIDLRKHKSKVYSRTNLESILQDIIKQISSCAFMKVGQFHRRIDDCFQEDRLLKCISMEYKSEGSYWSAQYEYLQLRMDLTKAIEEALLEEVLTEFSVFI